MPGPLPLLQPRRGMTASRVVAHAAAARLAGWPTDREAYASWPLQAGEQLWDTEESVGQAGVGCRNADP